MSGLSAKPSRVILFGVVLIGLAFATFTEHAWEDYWITFRASRNLATGNGLVFTVGDRLHTFTSPLGVLLPAALSWVTGNSNDLLVLWLFRLVSIGTLATGIVLLFQILSRIQKHGLAVGLGLALVALDAKTIDFSINGMETGLVIFFLALTLYGLLLPGPRQLLWLGLGWAGLMWSRPDSFVYIGVLGFAAFVFLPQEAAGFDRKQLIIRYFKAGILCAALYLPWFLWAWWYYGSPKPHTIVAKGTNLSPLSPLVLLRDFVLFPFSLLVGNSYHRWVFLPAYAWFGYWHFTLRAVGTLLGLAAAFAWTVPLLRSQTRVLSLAFYLSLFFLSHVVRSVFPWYLPAAAVLGYLTLALLFDQLLSLAHELPRLGWNRGWLRHANPLLRALAILLILGQMVVTILVARQMSVQQALIETGMRRQIGLWLRANASSPDDTVYLEPLGYIGYYSQLKMLDWPGLASRRVVEVRRRLGREHETEAYLELKPDWLVLRPTDVSGGTIIDGKRVTELYELVTVFDVSKQVDAIHWLPGRSYLNFDRTFLVYHRKPDGVAKPAG